LAGLINESKKVTIYCGIGAENANAEVVELSKYLKAPVAILSAEKWLFSLIILMKSV
jgi:thiamine pyrophosphate-dependent acetolactate synthase large subunit-like protein